MHFYTKTETGAVEPRHFVETKTGKNAGQLRPSRLSDVKAAAKKGEVWVPSVTTIQNLLAKPALVEWKVNETLQTVHDCILQSGDENQPGIPLEFDEFKKVMRAKTQERLDAAPKAGTDFHKLAENYLQGKEIDTAIPDPVWKALRQIMDYVNGVSGTGTVLCEHYLLNEDIQYAGCADVLIQNGVDGNYVIDFKTKETADKFKPGKMAYPEHAQQLAAYQQAASVSGVFDQCTRTHLINIFVCLETGEIDIYQHDFEEAFTEWQVFINLCKIWHLRNGGVK